MDENKIELTEDRQRWSLEEMEKDFIDYANSFDWRMDDLELEPRMNHGTETTNQINELGTCKSRKASGDRIPLKQYKRENHLSKFKKGIAKLRCPGWASRKGA